MLPFIILTGETTSTVADTMSTALGSVANSAISAIQSIVPVAAPVLGAVLVIGISIRAFKKLAGR